MQWYEVIGIVVVLLGFILTFVKNIKWKKIIENTKMVLEEAHSALEDGKITKAEWIAIVSKAMEVFIPGE